MDYFNRAIVLSKAPFMRKLAPLSAFVFMCHILFAQFLVNNNGAKIYVTDGALVVLTQNNPSLPSGLQNKTNAGQGQINNSGTIIIQGSLQNEAPINASGDTIEVTQDWTNNDAYNASNSWVYLNGNVPQQNINGTSVTSFNNLYLTGGPLKKQAINAVTTGVLNLNNAELATDAYQMLVTNTDPAAITWGTGFVSSVGAGNLSRVTSTAAGYVFPTGSPSYVNGPAIFRPVEMTIAQAGTDTFGACLVKGNATTDGYNVQSLDNTLCLVNPNFYHRLYNGSGAAAADLTMYYNSSTDGEWTDEAHWKNNEWNYIAPANPGSGLGFSTVTVPGVSDFNPNPFALARKKFQLSAGPGVSIVAGQSTVFNPVIGAATGSTILWSPDQDLSCDNCANPSANPQSTTWYTLTVTDAGGCKLSDSLQVTVIDEGLLLPTAFSPNGDGVNDVFHALNKNLAQIDLQVFNRWGELIYQTTDWTVGWDGTYKGMKQEVGVYVWQCSYRLIGETEMKSTKGNVTLIR